MREPNISARTYFLAYGALMLLFLINIGIAFLNLGWASMLIGVTIGLMQVAVLALILMEAYYEKPVIHFSDGRGDLMVSDLGHSDLNRLHHPELGSNYRKVSAGESHGTTYGPHLEPERSWKEIIADVVRDLENIFRNEIRLAGIELKKKATEAAKAGGMLGAAALLGFFAWLVS